MEEDSPRRTEQKEGLAPPGQFTPGSLGMKAHVPTSAVLNELLGEAPPDYVTLAWLMERLRERSFGVVMLLLGLVGVAPGASAVAGMLLVIPAVQMILARRSPVFPRFIASRRFQTRQIDHLVNRAIPPLQYLEKFVHPRWATSFEATKRVVGLIVLMLGLMLLAPLPLSNIIPSLVIILLSFAYLEEDGLLLYAALLASAIVLAIVSVALWAMIRESGRLGLF